MKEYNRSIRNYCNQLIYFLIRLAKANKQLASHFGGSVCHNAAASVSWPWCPKPTDWHIDSLSVQRWICLVVAVWREFDRIGPKISLLPLHCTNAQVWSVSPSKEKHVFPKNYCSTPNIQFMKQVHITGPNVDWVSSSPWNYIGHNTVEIATGHGTWYKACAPVWGSRHVDDIMSWSCDHQYLSLRSLTIQKKITWCAFDLATFRADLQDQSNRVSNCASYHELTG